MDDEIDETPEPSRSGIRPIDPLQVLEVFPNELRIQCQLNTEVSYNFTLKNIANRTVAFKVKTTAPRRYMVRPAQGTINSGETVPITIVLVKMSQYPDQSNPRNVRDKFLVQSFALQHETAPEELNTLWITKEKEHNPRGNNRAYYEHRLKCRLLIPSGEEQGSVRSPSSIAGPGPVSDVPDTNLGIVISPPPEPTLDLNSPSMKTPSGSLPPAPIPTPGEDVTETVEAPITHPSVPIPEVKADVNDPEPQASKSNQPGTTPDNQEKPTPIPERKFSTPLLANHPKEYEKMLAYSVKLTVEREALENKLAKLSEHNAFLLQENERLRKALAVEQGNSVAADINSPSDPKRRSVLDAIQEDGTRYGALFESQFDFSEDQANLVASQLANSSGIQLWQVLAVATLCFLIGRVL